MDLVGQNQASVGLRILHHIWSRLPDFGSQLVKLSIRSVSVVLLCIAGAAYIALPQIARLNEIRTQGISLQTQVDGLLKASGVDGHANVLPYFRRIELHGTGYTKDCLVAIASCANNYQWVEVLDVADCDIRETTELPSVEGFPNLIDPGQLEAEGESMERGED